jgi:uncharacterized membrane protein (DUF2068 family)
MTRNFSLRGGVRAVAVFEGAKALLVLMTGFGLFSLGHDHLREIAVRLVRSLHLNPAHRYPRIFIDALTGLTDTRLWILAGLALAYAIVRIVQAYGLWNQRLWAEWFGVLSGGIYLPIEIYELTRGVSPFKIAALVTNLGIVAFLGFMVAHSKQRGIEQPGIEPPGRLST